MGVSCFDYPLNVLVSCDYNLEESRIPEKVQWPRYYPNITFVNMSMCYPETIWLCMSNLYLRETYGIYMRVSLFELSP